MSEIAIAVYDLSKSYHRYTSTFWQAASLLGFRVPSTKYDVFWPLEGVSIEIKRGERVALIGRNGAGKTTLLRHVSGELAPTTGSLRITGNVKALFSLGDGFHPEFSGLQNMRTALALNGIAWSDIPRYSADIIEFTELEDFIDRPLKEYSAGMYARLGFAVATAIKPEILIIDEILGAGDAYFIGKCQQRIRQITGDGTTLLFVSHDMGSAQMMCERGIWLHDGKVRADGDILPVIKSYQAHVRLEEEVRLRASSVSMSRKAIREMDLKGGGLVRLIAPGNQAPASPCYVARVALGESDLVLAEMMIGSHDDDGPIYPVFDPVRTNWSKTTIFAGKKCRAFGDFGGQFVHAPLVVRSGLQNWQGAWVELEAAASTTNEIIVQFYNATAQKYETIGIIPADRAGEWNSYRFAFVREQASDMVDRSSRGEALSAGDHDRASSTSALNPRGARIIDFAFFDAAGHRRHTLVTGQPASCTMVVEAGEVLHDPVAVVAIYRPDGSCASQIISNRNGLAIGSVIGRFDIQADLSSLYIGPGDYVVSVALFRNLDQAVSAEDRAWDLHDRFYKLKILQADLDPFPVGIVNQPAQWALVKNTLGQQRSNSGSHRFNG